MDFSCNDSANLAFFPGGSRPQAKHVLEEAAHELQGIHRHDAAADSAGLLVGEAYPPVGVAENAMIGDGHPEHVHGYVLLVATGLGTAW